MNVLDTSFTDQGKQIKLNRNKTKIDFLALENQQLREQVNDLLEVLRANKETLLQMVHQSYNDKIDTIEPQSSTKHESRSIRQVPVILQATCDENSKLIALNERLTQEKNVALGKALIMEQMFEGADREKRALLIELQDKVEELKTQLSCKEQIIHQLEILKPTFEELTGVVIKYREVCSPNEASLHLHDELEALNVIVLKQIKKINDVQKQKEELQLSQELFKVRAMLLSSPQKTAATNNNNNANLRQSTNKKTILDKKYSVQPISNFNESILSFTEEEKVQNQMQLNIPSTKEIIKIHKQLLEDPAMDSEFEKEVFSPILSPLPDKVVNHVADRSIIAGDNSNLNISAISNLNNQIAIPKLDLVKAFKIQEINAKKSTAQQQQKQGGDLSYWMEKSKKLEKLLEECRKNLAREMLINKTLVIENEHSKRLNNELEARNQTLVEAYHQYEERWSRLYQAHQFYLEQYQNQQQRSHQRLMIINQSKSQLISDPRNTNSIRHLENSDAERTINRMRRADLHQKQNSMLLSRSIFDVLEEEIDPKPIPENYIDYQARQYSRENMSQYIGKQQAVEYLRDMAQDLNSISNQNSKNNLLINAVQQHQFLRRSNSNPFDSIPLAQNGRIYQTKQTIDFFNHASGKENLSMLDNINSKDFQESSQHEPGRAVAEGQTQAGDLLPKDIRILDELNQSKILHMSERVQEPQKIVSTAAKPPAEDLKATAANTNSASAIITTQEKKLINTKKQETESQKNTQKSTTTLHSNVVNIKQKNKAN